MNNKEQFDIIRLYEIKHSDEKCTKLMLVLINDNHYLTIYTQESLLAYKNLTAKLGELILPKMYCKLSKIKSYQHTQFLLEKAFKFKLLYQSLFYINLYGMKKIHPSYIHKLTKRFNIKGDYQFTIDDNYCMQYAEIEVRLPPNYDIFGKFISKANQNYFRFILSPNYKALLSK